MASLAPQLRQRFEDANGDPLVGGKLYSYQAGTSTPLGTFTDQTEGALNANPIILDTNGECVFWIGTNSYKFILKDSSDVQIFSVDGVSQNGAGSVGTPQLANLSVTTSKIADAAVTTNKLDDESVTTAKIDDGAVTEDKLDDDSVATEKLQDLSVTRAKLAAIGPQTSAPCGYNITSASTTYADVTNLSVTLTVTGRHVRIILLPDGNPLAGPPQESAWIFGIGYIRAIRGTTALPPVGNGFVDQDFGPFLEWIDHPAAGTYTYKIQFRDGALPGHVSISYVKLMVYEL